MIPKEFKKTHKLNREFSLIQYETTQFWNIEDYNNGSEEIFDFETNDKTGNSFVFDIAVSFDKEYKKLTEAKEYFIGCIFSIYKETYIDRLEIYIKENIDDEYTKKHFVQQEMLDTLEFTVNPYINNETKNKLLKSISRRKEFLKNELTLLGYKFKVSLNNLGKIKSVAIKDNSIVIIEESIIDLSDTSIKGKIIYLELIGFLDYIKTQEPNLNNHQIASLISAFIGEDAKTIYSYINPILSQGVLQKNNPFTNKKNVDKVKKQLINTGLKNIKTVR